MHDPHCVFISKWYIEIIKLGQKHAKCTVVILLVELSEIIIFML